MSLPARGLVSGLQSTNFSVVSRGAPASNPVFIDQAARTKVSYGTNAGSVSTQLTVAQILSDTLVVTPTGAAAIYVLPSAQAIFSAFNCLNVGNVVQLNIVNRGTQTATFHSLTGLGMNGSTTVPSNMSSVVVAPAWAPLGVSTGSFGPRSLNIEVASLNGFESTGPNTNPYAYPTFGATGAIYIY